MSKDKKYKVVSASAAAIETVVKPAVKHTHKIMLEGTGQIHGGIDDFFCTLDSSTAKKLNWFFRGLKSINRSTHKLIRYFIRSEYQDTSHSLRVIEKGLNKRQEELELGFEQKNWRDYKAWAFSSENRKLIRDIVLFINEHTRDFNNIPYHRLLQYFIAFGRLQTVSREKIWQLEKYDLDNNLERGLFLLSKYCKYSVAVYGKLLVRIIIQKKWYKLFNSESDEEILRLYLGIKAEDIAYSQLKSQRYLPAHAIILNTEEKVVILSIRGTMSVFDCLSDLTGDYTTYDYTCTETGEVISTGLVHSGIMTCARNLSAEVKTKILQLLNQNPDFSLVIVGHSLGAGATALLALYWLSDPEIMQKGFIALAYAPPAVVSSELNRYLKNFLFSCSFGSDIVCRMSFGSLKDCVEIVNFFLEKEKSPNSIKASNIVTNYLYKGKLSESVLISIYQELKERFTNCKLEPPGYIFQIFSKKKHKDYKLIQDTEDKYIGAFVDPKFFQEIVFGKTAFMDHFPNLYEKALNFIAGNLGK